MPDEPCEDLKAWWRSLDCAELRIVINVYTTWYDDPTRSGGGGSTKPPPKPPGHD